jgi:hypothetical protein
MGKVLGLKRPQLVTLHIASYLHHAGFSEMGRREFDFESLKGDLSYVEKTLTFLQRHNGFEDALNAIKNHRYRLDGKGTSEKIDVTSWSIESQILGWCVELDLRLNLPLSFGMEPDSISEIAETMVKDGTTIVTRPIVTVFEKAWKKGLILV